MSADKNAEATSFESAIEELEKLVTEMENGDLPLEQALAKFERGISLAKNSQEILKKAEQRVQILTNQADGESLQPIEQAGND